MAGRRRRARYDALAFDPDDAIVRLRMHSRILAGAEVLQGIGYVFGAPSTAPSLQLMSDKVPMIVWGGLLVIGGLLMLFRQLAIGNGICAAVCLVWALFALIVLIQGVATGWAWAWPFGLACAHIYALYRSARARQVAAAPVAG